MTPQQEHEFETKAEKMLAGQREVPNGRNFLAWVMRYQNNEAYREKFDNTFFDSPGSPNWKNEKYCPVCDKLRVWCECKTTP